jgi:hypothetical protein
LPRLAASQDGLAKISSPVNAPQRRFERMHDRPARRDRTTECPSATAAISGWPSNRHGESNLVDPRRLLHRPGHPRKMRTRQLSWEPHL